MNEYLSQISDNYEIVSDENGKLKLLQKVKTIANFKIFY